MNKKSGEGARVMFDSFVSLVQFSFVVRSFLTFGEQGDYPKAGCVNGQWRCFV